MNSSFVNAVSVIVVFVGGVIAAVTVTVVVVVVVVAVALKSKFKVNYLPRDYFISS